MVELKVIGSLFILIIALISGIGIDLYNNEVKDVADDLTKNQRSLELPAMEINDDSYVVA